MQPLHWLLPLTLENKTAARNARHEVRRIGLCKQILTKFFEGMNIKWRSAAEARLKRSALAHAPLRIKQGKRLVCFTISFDSRRCFYGHAIALSSVIQLRHARISNLTVNPTQYPQLKQKISKNLRHSHFGSSALEHICWPDALKNHVTQFGVAARNGQASRCAPEPCASPPCSRRTTPTWPGSCCGTRHREQLQ